MYDFAYQKPGSLADAVKVLSGDMDAKALAGGQTFIPVLKQRLNKPSVVVDLAKLGLSGITVSGNTVTIGAMTTHAAIAERRGERLPVAIAFGCPPAVTYAASAPLPSEIDEYLFAGFLNRDRIDLVDCISVPLQVPAAAQVVLDSNPGLRTRFCANDDAGATAMVVADASSSFRSNCGPSSLPQA